MNRTLVLIIVLAAAALAAWAQLPLRDFDAVSPHGSGNATPVEVTNFPVDGETGNIAVATPVVNRVLDILNGGTLTLDVQDEPWESEPFQTAHFTDIRLHAWGEYTGGAVACSIQWRWTVDGSWLDASITAPATNFDRKIAWGDVQGPEGRVTCTLYGGESATLTELLVLLRRE